jgi:tetratricopeptide (TPR) repeat protein
MEQSEQSFPIWHRRGALSSTEVGAPVTPESAAAAKRSHPVAGASWSAGSAWRRAAQAFLTLLLLWGAEEAARRSVAVWYYSQRTVQGLRHAIAWEPGNARYPAELSEALQNSPLGGDPAEAIHLAEEATQLSPRDARAWAVLASAYEAAGRMPDARRAFEQAVRCFPRSPHLNWQLGNFLLRANDPAGALDALRLSLAGDAAMRRAAFDTAWRAEEDPAEILARMIPPQPKILLQYLDYLAEKRRVDAAEAVWLRLLEAGFPFAPQAAFPYLDALLAEQRSVELVSAWDALAKRFPGRIAPRDSRGNRVTNGSFEFDPLNGGLDWRISPVEGAEARIVSENAFAGARCLKIAFAGTHNLLYTEVMQFVPVEPDMRYRLTAQVRAQDLSSDSGLRLLLRDAGDLSQRLGETPAILGTMPWSEVRLEFRTGHATRLLDLRVMRPASHKFYGNIGGTYWLDDVRVEAIGLDP